MYELSPFMIEVSQNIIPLSHLLTRLFAIVGGTFTVLAIIDSAAFKIQSFLNKSK